MRFFFIHIFLFISLANSTLNTACAHPFNQEHLKVLNVPDSLAIVFNTVSQQFPELKNTRIRLQFKQIKTTMQAQPVYAPWFIFRKEYKVIINNNPNFIGVKFSSLTPAMKEAIVAHELCHIKMYEEKRFIEFLQHGLAFLNNKSRRYLERLTDYYTIKKGFGRQLAEWAQYAMFDGPATPKYKKFKQTYYLNPTEIDSIVKTMNLN
jgi:hypothetical protein